ncbi:MAG: DNA-3-methyladenine glycosylase [Candidatus Dormibacteria bacterium]
MRAAFYERPVLEVAPDLIGCVLDHGGCSGVIVETEAYHHSEAACHAYVGLTARTSTLFAPAGIAYVYRSYGIHALINAVCEPEDVGAAVLIRALAPLRGLDAMRARRGLQRERDLCSGPGKLTQALGIGLQHNATDLDRGPVRITPREAHSARPEVVSDRRIGITRAVELPWRFCAAGSPYLSRPLSCWGGGPVRSGAAL